MASVHTWGPSKSKNKRGGLVTRNSSKQHALDGSRPRFLREAQGKLRYIMRKPRNGNSEGKDRLRALAAAAARAAGANLTTYFADDDKLPVNPDGTAAVAQPIKVAPVSGAAQQFAPSAATYPAGSPMASVSSLESGLPVDPTSLRYTKPEEAELQAKQAARAARLITSGDGFVTHMETSRSTSGELPPHLGPPGGPGQPNSLEFLPVLPPMHVHSHPVTTGQGPTQVAASPQYVRPTREPPQAVVPKIVLAQPSSGGSGAAGQPGRSMDLDRARSGSGGLPGHIGLPPHHPQQRSSPIPQVTISLKRDNSLGAGSGDEGSAATNGGAFLPGGRRRGNRAPGLPPLGAKVTGRRGKRGGGPSPSGGQPEQSWAALSHVVTEGGFSAAAAGQPQHPQPPQSAPGAMPVIPSDASAAAAPEPASAQPQPPQEDEPMAEGEPARNDVAMEEPGAPEGLAVAGQAAETPAPPAMGSGGSGSGGSASPRFSPFSVAPPAGESSTESDTESEESRDKQAGEGAPQAARKRAGSPGAEPGREPGQAPAKKVRGADGRPRAARAASLNTVIAAVEERATRQGSGAMDAAVGSAPTTVEDCLQSSSFLRKNKRSAKPPREDGAPQRVWGSVGGPLTPSTTGPQEAMPGIASLSLEEQDGRRVRAAVAPAVAAAAAAAPGRSGLALSSSESAAAISLLALAPQTPPSASSPSAPPLHQSSGDLEDTRAAAAASAALPAAPGPDQPAPMQISGGSVAVDGTKQRAGEENNNSDANLAQTTANGSSGGGGAAGKGANGLGRASSTGLPIAPLRLDSGLQAQGPNGAGSDMAMGLWSGKLKHRMATQGGYSTVDLLNLTALIPDRYLEQLPPTLFVTELLARSAVQMSKHYIVQCRLGFLTDRQLTKLQLLANSKLVAVCQLQHCKLTLVPYIEARSGQLRIMGFLIADDLGT